MQEFQVCTRIVHCALSATSLIACMSDNVTFLNIKSAFDLKNFSEKFYSQIMFLVIMTIRQECPPGFENPPKCSGMLYMFLIKRKSPSICRNFVNSNGGYIFRHIEKISSSASKVIVPCKGKTD